MTLEESLILHLRNDAALAAQVSTRIYGAGLLEQSATKPALTVQRINSLPLYAHQGRSGLARTRAQINVWASSYSSGITVAGLVRRAMDTFGGAGGRARRIGDVDLGRDPDSLLYHQAQDYEFYREED